MTINITVGNIGTGGTATLKGVDGFGSLVLNTGSGAGGGLIAELDFSGNDFVEGLSCRLAPLNAAALGLSRASLILLQDVNAKNIGAQVFMTGTASSTTYEFAYQFS